ncbi:MAG: hypothetical protein CMJ46_13250 [Planctomyces sp.]|nr:hypothetical protein [Planctomyces sp.]
MYLYLIANGENYPENPVFATTALIERTTGSIYLITGIILILLFPFWIYCGCRNAWALTEHTKPAHGPVACVFFFYIPILFIATGLVSLRTIWSNSSVETKREGTQSGFLSIDAWWIMMLITIFVYSFLRLITQLPPEQAMYLLLGYNTIDLIRIFLGVRMFRQLRRMQNEKHAYLQGRGVPCPDCGELIRQPLPPDCPMCGARLPEENVPALQGT